MRKTRKWSRPRGEGDVLLVVAQVAIPHLVRITNEPHINTKQLTASHITLNNLNSSDTSSIKERLPIAWVNKAVIINIVIAVVDE